MILKKEYFKEIYEKEYSMVEDGVEKMLSFYEDKLYESLKKSLSNEISIYFNQNLFLEVFEKKETREMLDYYKDKIFKDLRSLLSMYKKRRGGQFNTTNSDYILKDMETHVLEHVNDKTLFIEPFVGKGDLLRWLDKTIGKKYRCEIYDIDKDLSEYHSREMQVQDTILYPPFYDKENTYLITNPPFLARNKTKAHSHIFREFVENDLYKCFIRTIIKNPVKAGILIIPSSFFLSPRKSDTDLRKDFFEQYKINKVKFFEEKVFDDTSETVVCFSFEKNVANTSYSQMVNWEFYKSKQLSSIKKFIHLPENKFIVGGDIYFLSQSKDINISRLVNPIQTIKGKQVLKKVIQHPTGMVLYALDGGTLFSRICLRYEGEEGVFYGKHDSRSKATVCVEIKKQCCSGCSIQEQKENKKKVCFGYLNEKQQKKVCNLFNELIEKKRKETYSLCLPQYRESREYARKRIPFSLAYVIINHIISDKKNELLKHV